MVDKPNDEQMTELFAKQKELMEKVPHQITMGTLHRMDIVRKLMEKSLLYLSSTGHKPWRPNPLSESTQLLLLEDIAKQHKLLQRERMLSYPSDHPAPRSYTDNLLTSFGIIEESLEYLNAVDSEPDVAQLEELTDILFFYLEQVLRSGFTWDQIIAEYHRKHAVNMKRYEDGAKGDFSWDDRDKKENL